MQRKVSFLKGEFYHLYNRGVDKRKIFFSTADYKRFMALLYLANSNSDVRIRNNLRNATLEEILTTIGKNDSLVAIGAFCLMPNHFHLLVTPLVEDGVSKFMLKLQTGYSMYFNIKNERNGSLFQGPFKSEHANDDMYLKYLFSYIHLNPAKLKDPKWKEHMHDKALLLKFVNEYPYSSLNAYIQNKHLITNPTVFPEYLSSQIEIEKHVADWLSSNSDQG